MQTIKSFTGKPVLYLSLVLAAMLGTVISAWADITTCIGGWNHDSSHCTINLFDCENCSIDAHNEIVSWTNCYGGGQINCTFYYS
jgi:hypothetical protein